MSIQLDLNVQIAVLEPLRVVNRSLLELLDGFDADDWNCHTIQGSQRKGSHGASAPWEHPTSDGHARRV
jgi:hypothetical protein